MQRIPLSGRPRTQAAWVFSSWWIASFIGLLNIWIGRNFGQLELEQFVYHVVNLAEVIKPMSWGFMVLSGLLVFGVPTLLAMGATLYTQGRAWKSRDEISNRFTPSVPNARGGLRKILTLSRFALVGGMVPILFLGVSAPALAHNVGVFSFVEASKPSNFFERFYQFPDDIRAPETPLNLVVIYVESLENTYRSEALWGENLMDSLDQETVDWVEFSKFREVRGTGWTIAGMVASQCGVLLKEENSFDLSQQLGLTSINRIGERVEKFLPGITCLGDVLGNSGYKNVFVGGADPEFAGKGKFLSEHGYQRILGKPYWEMRGETEFTKWGLHDDDLLRHAKQELDSLHAQEQPFNLTILTVDTHRPEGHLSPTCERKGAENLPGIVSCTSDLLADFVAHMKERGYLEDTAVVITGDHLTMPNSVQDIIDQQEDRTIYNRFYSPIPVEKNRDELMHFSIFPTILDMLGFHYSSTGLGLGISGVRPLHDGVFSIYDVADLDEKLRRPSELYEIFWGNQNSSSSQN